MNLYAYVKQNPIRYKDAIGNNGDDQGRIFYRNESKTKTNYQYPHLRGRPDVPEPHQSDLSKNPGAAARKAFAEDLTALQKGERPRHMQKHATSNKKTPYVSTSTRRNPQFANHQNTEELILSYPEDTEIIEKDHDLRGMTEERKQELLQKADEGRLLIRNRYESGTEEEYLAPYQIETNRIAEVRDQGDRRDFSPEAAGPSTSSASGGAEGSGGVRQEGRRSPSERRLNQQSTSGAYGGARPRGGRSDAPAASGAAGTSMPTRSRSEARGPVREAHRRTNEPPVRRRPGARSPPGGAPGGGSRTRPAWH